jgi:hypothetical protein
MPGRPDPHEDEAHDVLAAEAFAMPSADPALRKEAAHDVLAAEAFAMPSADPSLRHQPITLPDDPSGSAEPHDVLAAEEFAMPAGRGSSEESGGGPLALARRAPSRLLVGIGAAVALLALIALRARRRRPSRRAWEETPVYRRVFFPRA